MSGPDPRAFSGHPAVRQVSGSETPVVGVTRSQPHLRVLRPEAVGLDLHVVLVTPEKRDRSEGIARSEHGSGRGHALLELRELALKDLIDRRLVIQAFKKESYQIPDHIVDQRVHDIIRESFGGDRNTIHLIDGDGVEDRFARCHGGCSRKSWSAHDEPPSQLRHANRRRERRQLDLNVVPPGRGRPVTDVLRHARAMNEAACAAV